MQTEWSTPEDGAADTWVAATHDQAPHGGPVPADGRGDVDQASGDGARTAGGDQVGEEELHRSAVDAVDGLLDEVELALARLDDGTYGRCEACGEPIDDGRLAELPIVRSCGRCAQSDGDPSGSAPFVPASA